MCPMLHLCTVHGALCTGSRALLHVEGEVVDDERRLLGGVFRADEVNLDRLTDVRVEAERLL